MKIKFLTLACLSITMSLTSCNLDNSDEDNFFTNEFPACNLVIPADGNAFATNASYKLTFYNLSDKITVGTSNLWLGGSNLSFLTNNMQLEQIAYNSTQSILKFTGGSYSGNNLTITNLSGYTSSIFNVLASTDPIFPGYPYAGNVPLIMNYTVNSNTTVKTFMRDAIYNGTTTIRSVGSGTSFSNDGVRYRVVFAEDMKTASVIFYDAKFAENMPVTIHFVLRDIPVTYGIGGGYTIQIPEGESIIPEMYENNGYTPAEGYPFTSFLLHTIDTNLTNISIDYTVEIRGNKYLGQFSGPYVLLPVE